MGAVVKDSLTAALILYGCCALLKALDFLAVGGIIIVFLIGNMCFYMENNIC